MRENEFHGILSMAVNQGASDLMFAVGEPPLWKFNDKTFLEIKAPHLTDKDTYQIVSYLTDGCLHDIDKLKYKDVSYEVEDVGRFRASICKSREELRVVMRVIPSEVRSFADLNLPAQLVQIAELPRGLVLVSGATGQGKSTTLSVMIDHINKKEPVHILTIEDPIEFVYRKARALITQREVGEDTTDYRSALREALRLSPNVILLGEIRDKETLEAALEAAGTGHLVLSAIHGRDALKTISRILSFYDYEEQRTVRERLAESLSAIVSLRLLDACDPSMVITRVPAVELLRMDSLIAEALREDYQNSGGKVLGHMEKQWTTREMWTFDQYIFDLFKRKMISANTAYKAASNPKNMESYFIKEGVSPERYR